MTGALRITHYDWSGGREATLRLGPDDGPTVIVAPPLFDEANRTRAFTVAILRALAAHGIGGALPDLPSMGDSFVASAAVTLPVWQQAFAAAARSLGRPHTVAIRGGALVTLGAIRASSWIFAPVDGRSLVRDLDRARQIAEPGSPSLIDLAMTAPVETRTRVAGMELSTDLLHALVDAIPDRATPNRVVRLADDGSAADAKYPGAPLWRRAEPGNDLALAALLARDIADWVARCGG